MHTLQYKKTQIFLFSLLTIFLFANYALALTCENDFNEIEALAAKGDPVYENFLGECYRKEGPRRDFQKARLLFERAMNKGNPKGATNLGLLYLFGEGVEKNSKTAIDLFKKAADNGYCLGKFNLAMAYEFGEGGKFDLETANYVLKLYNEVLSDEKSWDNLKKDSMDAINRRLPLLIFYIQATDVIIKYWSRIGKNETIDVNEFLKKAKSIDTSKVNDIVKIQFDNVIKLQFEWFEEYNEFMGANAFINGFMFDPKFLINTAKAITKGVTGKDNIGGISLKNDSLKKYESFEIEFDTFLNHIGKETNMSVRNMILQQASQKYNQQNN